MNQYDDDFLKYLERTITKSAPSRKKEIDGTYQAVMIKAGLKSKAPHFKKTGRFLLIAAAVMTCTVVTAAAYAIGPGNLFKGFFEKNVSSAVNGDNQAVSLSESQVAIIDKSAIVPNYTAEDNGTTVQVKAIVGDESCAYILLDVIAPKGTILDKDKYEFEEMPIDFHNQQPKECKNIQSSSISWDITTQNDENLNDNIKSFVIRINAAGLNLQNREIQMTLKNLSISSGKLTFTPIIKGEWKFDLQMDYSTDSKIIQIDKVTHFSGNYATVKTVSLSALSAKVDFTNLMPQEKFMDGFTAPDMLVELRNGTHYSVYSGSGSQDDSKFTTNYHFDVPLDFDQVVKITLGDVEIPFK